MPIFVHIADERDAQAIRCNGLTLPKSRWRNFENDHQKWGVFALPVIENFTLSHQWVRELKRRGHRSAVGIYFHVADTELVWVGLYNQAKIQVTAAEATAKLRNEQLLGYEVIIPRSISSAEVSAIRVLPSVGWRFFPGAKGSPPRCLCKFCNGGDINSRRMRARLDPDGNYA
jgi:hypothetical protein